MLEIIPIPALKDNYIWVIVNNAYKTAIAFDPGEAHPLIEFLEQHALTLKAVLITHHHWDHTNGIADLIKKYPGLPIYASNANIPGVNNTNSPIEIEHFPLFQMLHIPGHTLDHAAYYSEGMVFTGDTLFSAGCGRVFEGTMEQMVASLQTLASLPDDTRVYCGHEYTLKNLEFAQLIEPNNKKIKDKIESVQQLRSNNLSSLPSTIQNEKEINPFLRCDIKEVIAAAEKYARTKLSNAVQVFSCLREWKNSF